MTYFNELKVDLDDELFFSSEINERTKENPNMHISELCEPCDDSLDEYAKILTKETFCTGKAQ
jgi:formylmethanofuran dehydrogenase subunit E